MSVTSEHRTCLACHAPLQPGARFCAVCGEPVRDDTDDPIVGQVVGGRYRVLQRVGEGGMAVVYRAEQTFIRRLVALKLLRPEYSNDRQWVERFRREAESASRIHHPSAVAIHDFGRHDDPNTGAAHLYIAMELVEGLNLAATMAGRRLAWRRACRIGEQIADALAEAHKAGVIHRDLKPQNVMVTKRGEEELAKVLDFGIALIRVEGSGRLTRPNVTLGTPDFLAPEVYLGDAATPQSDIYALGALLYEMFAGRTVFPRESTSAILKAHVHERPDRLSDAAPDANIPLPVDELVASMLEKNPGDRPRSMAEVARRISWILDRDTGMLPRIAPETPISDVDSPVLQRLLRRLEKSSDFPAFAGNVSELNALCDSEDATPDKLADVILRDYAITEKLLRMVNSAYLRRGQKPITTVSRAVVVLGFEQVRRIATSLMLWQHLSGGRDSFVDGAVQAIGSALLAREMADDIEGVEPEEAFVAAMFHQFGRQLVRVHLPDEAGQIEQRAASGEAEDAAAAAVLGLPYEDLGMAIATRMQFPAALVEAMQRPTHEMEGSPSGPRERLVCVAAFSNELSGALGGPEADRLAAVEGLQQRFGRGLGMNRESVGQAMSRAGDAAAEMSKALGVPTDEDGPMKRLLGGMSGYVQATTGPVPQVRTPAPQPTEPAGILKAAAANVSELVRTGAHLDDVVVAAMEGMYRGAGFERVIFALRDFKIDHITARYALGGDTRDRRSRFAFPMVGPNDLIRRSLATGEDLVVRDARLPAVRDRLPTWLLEVMDPGAFALFPLGVRGTPVGLIYGDTPTKGRTPPWLDGRHQTAVSRMRDDVVRALVALGKKRKP